MIHLAKLRQRNRRSKSHIPKKRTPFITRNTGKLVGDNLLQVFWSTRSINMVFFQNKQTNIKWYISVWPVIVSFHFLVVLTKNCWFGILSVILTIWHLTINFKYVPSFQGDRVLRQNEPIQMVLAVYQWCQLVHLHVLSTSININVNKTPIKNIFNYS